MANQQALFCLTLFLCCHFGTEATVTLSPTEIRVCNQESKVVFTCWTSDAFLTWHVGNFLYQFTNAATGNAPKMLGQFRLEIINSSSGVIMSTATAENATALGASKAAVSCFGSVDDPNVTKSGYILARDPPSSPDLVNISVNSDSNVTVFWSSVSSNVCLDHIKVDISMCSSDMVIFSLKADSNATTISHPLPDNISGVCATITPVDDRGRTPSEINKICSCTSTVLTSPTPTSTRHHEEINLPASIIGGSTATVLILFVVMATIIVVGILIWRIRKCKKDEESDQSLDPIPPEGIDTSAVEQIRERTASQLQDVLDDLHHSRPMKGKQLEEQLENFITIAQERKNEVATLN